MNSPTDVTRLVPYVNREQYGDRPLLKGPHFDAKLIGTDVEDKYGRLEDRYEVGPNMVWWLRMESATLDYARDSERFKNLENAIQAQVEEQKTAWAELTEQEKQP